jgi:Uroporphyrinogen decarboxylase (URO-D)
MSNPSIKPPLDYQQHNQEVRLMWEAYNHGSPYRVPIQFSMNARMIIQNHELNTWGYTWKDYFENPEVRWSVELAFQKWVRLHVVQDSEMGLPQTEWAGIGVNYQNCDEAAWFGCPFYFPDDDMPFILPILKADKSRLYAMTAPDPLHGGIMLRAMEHYEYLEDKRKHVAYEGIPVGKTWVFGQGTDGPFTVACNLRGASEIAQDLYEDPQYVHDLLGFITDAIIARMKQVIPFNGGTFPNQGWSFADDSIELISNVMYKEFVLPYHQKLLSEFSLGGPNGIHLCGRVQHHLEFLTQQLNIKTFDLGFPTDMAKARVDLGDDVTLIGNIAPHLLRLGPEDVIRDRVKELCTSGVMQGGRFILHEGNNCAPGTPLAHFQAMYDAGREYGRYKSTCRDIDPQPGH